MADLIPILSRPIGDEINSVDARDLHAGLGVGRDFSNWIKGRIEELSLVIHEDFEVFAESGENGGRPRLQYVLSLDAAKHLALAERNVRGREVRAYFIAAEKRLRSISSGFNLRDPAQRLAALHQTLELLNESEAKVAVLEADVAAKGARLEEVAGAIELHERIETASGHHTFIDAAKMIGVQPGELIAFLLDRKYVYRRERRSKKTGRLIATERWLHLKAPLFYVAVSERFTAAGESIQAQQTYVTPAGLERFAAEIIDWTPSAAEAVAA